MESSCFLYQVMPASLDSCLQPAPSTHACLVSQPLTSVEHIRKSIKKCERKYAVLAGTMSGVISVCPLSNQVFVAHSSHMKHP